MDYLLNLSLFRSKLKSTSKGFPCKAQCAQSGFDPPNFKSYRDPVFQVRMGCGNHPLCSVFSNSVPPSIDFFKKRFWSLINCRKLAINPKLLMWKKVNMGGRNWRKLSIGGDSHNPSWPEKRGLYNSWNLRGQNHSEHTVTSHSKIRQDWTPRKIGFRISLC